MTINGLFEPPHFAVLGQNFPLKLSLTLLMIMQLFDGRLEFLLIHQPFLNFGVKKINFGLILVYLFLKLSLHLTNVLVFAHVNGLEVLPVLQVVLEFQIANLLFELDSMDFNFLFQKHELLVFLIHDLVALHLIE